MSFTKTVLLWLNTYKLLYGCITLSQKLQRHCTDEAPSFLRIRLQGARAVVDGGQRVEQVRAGVHASAHDVQLAPVSLQSPIRVSFSLDDVVTEHMNGEARNRELE